LVCSDEDQINESGLRRLMEFIGENSPDFVSPQAEVNGRLYRGRKTLTELDYAQPQDASFYISGLCFKTESAEKYLSWLPQIVKENALVEVYPQTALAGCLVAEGSGFWLDAMVTRQLDELPTHIAHSDGRAYYHLNGRFEQIKGSLLLADRMISSGDLTRKSYDSILLYKNGVNRQIFRRLRSTIFDESPEMARCFDTGARRYYLFSWVTKFYGNKFSTLVARITPSPLRKIVRRFI